MNNRKYVISIAGAGGIGRAAGLLLREFGNMDFDIYIGDMYKEAADTTVTWIKKASQKPGKVESFTMPRDGSNPELDTILENSDIVLDCLPGSEAPRIAKLAKKFDIHYVNLTEYVSETNEVKQIAADSKKGFILQTGLAPGFVDVLANGLFQKFCKKYGIDKAETLNMKVGALTQTAYPPHYYGFTWSPVGVATLYVKPAVVIRNYKLTHQASRTERSKILLNGIEYEEDLTSGGAADLPEALEGRVRNLDYKTLRYPGHFDWIDGILREIPHGEDTVQKLQEKMELSVPLVEDDQVVIYASVSGFDNQGKLRIIEKSFLIKPLIVAGRQLRAIQATTAAGLVESARLLLTNGYKGCILQSQIDCDDFLNGPYVSAVYK